MPPSAATPSSFKGTHLDDAGKKNWMKLRAYSDTKHSTSLLEPPAKRCKNQQCKVQLDWRTNASLNFTGGKVYYQTECMTCKRTTQLPIARKVRFCRMLVLVTFKRCSPSNYLVITLLPRHTAHSSHAAKSTHVATPPLACYVFWILLYLSVLWLFTFSWTT